MASNNPDLSDNIVHDNDLHDNELRSRFAELRREEEAQGPAFALPRPNGMRHGSRLQPRLGRIAAVALCLAGIIAGVLFLQLLRPHVDRSPGKAPVSLTEWKAPTDFLLETPGRELLRAVPEIGAWHDLGKRQKHSQYRKQL